MTQVQEDYTAPASEETWQLVAERLRKRNIEAVIVDDGDQARTVVLERLPEGAELRTLRQVEDSPGCRDLRRHTRCEPL